jgi:hypothetical protein
MTESKKRTGRPPIDPEKRKGYAVSFRMRDGHRDALQRRADQAGRSLSEEIEYRITESFRHDALASHFGGEDTLALVKVLASAIELVERRTGKKWMSDAATRVECSATADTMLKTFLSPAGHSETPATVESRLQGEYIARMILGFSPVGPMNLDSKTSDRAPKGLLSPD